MIDPFSLLLLVVSAAGDVLEAFADTADTPDSYPTPSVTDSPDLGGLDPGESSPAPKNPSWLG